MPLARIINRLSLILVLLIGLGLNPSPALSETSPEEDFVDQEIIIKYRAVKDATPFQAERLFIDHFAKKYQLQDGLSASLFSKVKRKHAKYRKLRKLSKYKHRSQLALVKLDHVKSKKELKQMIHKLNQSRYQSNDYEIEAVYPNYLYEISETQTNDELAPKQWAHDYIQPELLWDITKGDGVTVAVIDTGVDYNHEDLAANIWVNEDEIPNNGIDDDGNGFVDDIRGWDFVSSAESNCIAGEDCGRSDNDPRDVNGHGTHVAGIIGAVQNNTVGISGIAPEVKIMPIRAGYSTGSSAFLKTSDIIDSVAYAINNDADVINMSFAGAGLDALHDIIKLADDLGIVMVAAAGNNSTSNFMYPAAFNEVISVGAIDNNSLKLNFSNYGDWVDIVAPGSWIISTIPNNSYDFKSGTSMSSPLVAGIAALIKAKSKLQQLDGSTVKARIVDSSVHTFFRRFQGDATQTIGGLSAEIQFPLEVDDINMPANALLGESVSITAQVSDSAIVDYDWNSDQDGYLGDTESIHANLSEGLHAVSVRVRNVQGEWSEPAFKTINVSASRSVTPSLFTNFKFKINKRNRRLYAGLGGRENRKNIKAYKWVSNVNGTVSQRRRMDLSKLSPGFHKLSLLLQDQSGNWSSPIQRILEI